MFELHEFFNNKKFSHKLVDQYFEQFPYKKKFFQLCLINKPYFNNIYNLVEAILNNIKLEKCQICNQLVDFDTQKQCEKIFKNKYFCKACFQKELNKLNPKLNKNNIKKIKRIFK